MVVACGLPLRGLRECLVEHPFADASDETGLLRERDELGGGHQAAFGMVPAQEHLDRGDLPVAQVDLGLEDDSELALVESPVQVVGRAQPVDRVHPVVSVNNSRRARPRSLARCRATSASRNTASGAGGSSKSPDSAMPVENERNTSSLSMRNGSAIASVMRSDTSSASLLLVISVATTQKTSLPNRATMSFGPTAPCRRWVTRRSARSPASWPSESFTSLKWSRSSKSTATCCPRWRAAAIISAVASSRTLRVGSPVSGSYSPAAASCSSRIRRSDRSRVIEE